MEDALRKTKIICTLGPAVDSDEMIRKLILSGMDCARFNFSHGIYSEHLERMDRVRRVSESIGKPVALLLDTKGPEIRLGLFNDGFTVLESGAEFILDTDVKTDGDVRRVGITYKFLADNISVGTKILIDDGKIELRAERLEGDSVICKVINGGRVSNRKSINIPGITLPMDYISPADREDILFGIEQKVDFIAASFVRSGDDVRALRKLLCDNGGENIRIISKIENDSGIKNLEEIIELSDGIMVARGDLGVEVPFNKIPAMQKKMITMCNRAGKLVITATQMLESMTKNPRPTRAEVSDVANAVYDGTSAVMLSGESAAGKYPVETVRIMSDIVEETERHIDYVSRFHDSHFKIKNKADAVSHATCGMAIDIGAKAIVVTSNSGTTVRMVSRFRAPMDIIGMATDKAVWYKLALSWGVLPVMSAHYNSTDVLFYEAEKAAINNMPSLRSGDSIVITAGTAGEKSGNTNTIKMVTISR